MVNTETELAVIGGGAAGLTAAAEAARRGARVLLLERLPRVGKKILLTGNGRCNLANRSIAPEFWHGSLPQRTEILHAFGSAEDFFAARGLFCRADEAGRLYPTSNTAASVLDALRFDAAAQGVEVHCDCQVQSLAPQKNGFLLQGATEAVFCRSVIFSAGGAAAPNCGTDGSAFAMLRHWHLPTAQVPALAPIKTDVKLVSALKGQRVTATVRLVAQKKTLAEQTGEVQFADGALSGICVFQLARLVRADAGQALSLRLLPEWDEKTIRARLAALFVLRGALPAEELLTGLLPKRVGQALLKRCGISGSITAAQISAAAKTQLLQTMLDFRFPVLGSASFSSAQVTAGGICGSEVTAQLESRRLPGLFFAGECLDVDGDCGGYNLLWAWASGVCAGRAAAERLHPNRSVKQ